MGHFGNLREMFARSQSRTVPVLVVGADVAIGFDRKRFDELLQRHGM